MRNNRGRGLIFAILAGGILLRVIQGAVTPYTVTYDNHLEPINILLNEQRLPKPTECWSCYHPPLFYLTGAVAFEATSRLATLGGANPAAAHDAGGKAVQFVSVIAGCITLVLCWRILVVTGPWPDLCVAAGLGVVAFLPAHIRMSAMATNDVFAQMWMTAMLLMVLRARRTGWATFSCILVGVMAGAATLSKAYGMVSVAFALFACALGRDKEPGEASEVGQALPSDKVRGPWTALWKRLALVGVTCVVVGGEPSIRNMWISGKPIVDNFELFDSRQKIQPPASLAGVSFFSFRPGALFQHPWLHMTTVDSFPTELFARLWFDYSGFQNSLLTHKPWTERRRLIEASHPGNENRAFFEEFLNYEESSTPAPLRWVGRCAYALGLPLTLLAIVGLAGALWHGRFRGTGLLFAVYLIGCLFIPVLQTLRLPIFSAMKSEYSLGALACGAFGVAWMLARLPRHAMVIGVGVTLGLLAALAIVDLAYLWQIWGAPRYS